MSRKAAMPSDVRWRLCPTVTVGQFIGAAPQNFWGIAPVKYYSAGRSQTFRTSSGIAANLQQLFHILGRSPQHGAVAALDDWPLNQIRMLDHQRNNFIGREFTATQIEFFIYRLAGAQELTGLDLHLGDQISQLLLRERLSVVVHFLKRNAALPEQLVQFTTLRSSRLFVDCNLSVRHPNSFCQWSVVSSQWSVVSSQ